MLLRRCASEILQVRRKLPFDKRLDSVLSDSKSSLALLPLPKLGSRKTGTESQTTSQRRTSASLPSRLSEPFAGSAMKDTATKSFAS